MIYDAAEKASGLTLLDPSAHVWEDARGWGIRPLAAARVSAGEAAECHVVQVRIGSVRGNHLHPEAREWLLVCGGPAELAWIDPGASQLQRRRLDGERPVLLEIPPGTAHAIRCEGPGELVLVSFADRTELRTERCDPALLEPHG